MYRENIVYRGFSSIHGFRHPVEFLEHIPGGYAGPIVIIPFPVALIIPTYMDHFSKCTIITLYCHF